MFEQGFAGNLIVEGQTLARAGFMPALTGPGGLEVGPSLPLFTRGAGVKLPDEIRRLVDGDEVQRTEVTGDIQSILFHLGKSVMDLERGITSSMTAFPVRENLEAEAKILVPLETPVRNKLPRIPGAGLASKWKQLTSLGGGYGTSVDQPGGVSNLQMFFGEAGAPAAHTSVYADKTASYKLLGDFGSVTGFAMAAKALVA